MKRILVGATAMLAAALFFVPRVVGQTPEITLSVSPQTFDITANPGDSISNSFRIVNGTDKEVKLVVKAKNFNVSGEEGGVELTEETTNWSVADWITVDPTETTIPARGNTFFDFTINVPDGAEPGSHFGAIVVRSDAEPLNDTGPSVAQEIGPLVLVSVSGDITEAAEIDSFGSTRAFWFSSPVELVTRLNNTGNVHFKPTGTITIKNMFGSEVTTINLTEQNVLPDSIRQLLNEWDPGITSFGRYTADLSLVYGDDDTILVASTSFFVFPLITTLVVVGGLVFLVSAIRGRSRLAKAFKALAGR